MEVFLFISRTQERWGMFKMFHKNIQKRPVSGFFPSTFFSSMFWWPVLQNDSSMQWSCPWVGVPNTIFHCGFETLCGWTRLHGLLSRGHRCHEAPFSCWCLKVSAAGPFCSSALVNFSNYLQSQKQLNSVWPCLPPPPPKSTSQTAAYPRKSLVFFLQDF